MRADGHWKFIPRLFKFRHLEFDSATQQLLWTVVNPRKLYRYHQNLHEVRGQWFRDDPAFLLLVLIFQTVCVLAYTLWLQTHVRGFFLALLWAWLVDCILSGILVASCTWLGLKLLASRRPAIQAAPEWAYGFDVHLNAFFPLALGIYGVQGLFLPLLTHHSWISLLLANTLWAISIVYYIYITFLGYATIPIHNAVALLYAVLPVALLFVLALPFKWNFSLLFESYYSWRIGH
ncbi:hypothetical protein EMCRGX_G033809 [Ephydatia muelleri]